MQINQLEESIFSYIDRVKELLSPDIWKNVLLDCTKNELFVLWFLFRKGESNMTQVAEEINVPLNTATGIISRMEKKGLVERERSLEDKRIVTIRLAEYGRSQLQKIIAEVTHYGTLLFASFDSAQIELLMSTMEKLMEILLAEGKKEEKQTKIRKIEIE
ncbi:MAG: hypothetical protein PWP24_814 [Clostridiales bacterium]|nr:hypothetical protein [Clostridiales bacterium]